MDEYGKSRATREPLLATCPPKGGFRTLPFIIGNEGFERAATFGLASNMIVYLMRDYGLQMATGSNVLFFWTAASNFAPVVCAFLADSYTGRFRMIGFGSVVCLMGMMLLWSTTMIPSIRPSCDAFYNNCVPVTAFQLFILCFAFGLISIGSGGIRSSTLAFGADQVVHNNDDTRNKGILEKYFSWYYFTLSCALMVSLTCIVYLQDRLGWEIGFGVPAGLVLLGTFCYFMGSTLYIKSEPKSSLITGFARVLVASRKNRGATLSCQGMDKQYHVAKGSTLYMPSEKLRFLNKACIVKDPQQDLTPNGKALDPWRLCTVDQVEELKALLAIIPLWSTGIMLSVNACQGSFRVIQAKAMDRHVLRSLNFEIPAGSFGFFALLSLMIWITLYDRVLLPVTSRALGKPFHLDVKTRMGIGLFLSFLSMTVAAVVEAIRREAAIKDEGSPMSALWLVPQLCLFGLAEAFTAIAQNEFFYSEFPKSMSSVASTLYGLGTAVASIVASIIMSVIDHITEKSGGHSWVSSDINKGRYDYYFWVLALLSLLNYVYFLFCSRAYGPCKGNKRNTFCGDDETSDR